MRRRYFSPELKPQLRHTLDSIKNKQSPGLRWMGSQVRLPGPIGFQEENQNVIGSYTYFRNKEIGSGYSSKVYKAKKSNQATTYAIKVIDLKKYTNSNMQMLSNEIKILKTLNHPNVIKCYDVFKTETQCFIVTEYCDQGDLLAHLTKRGRCSQREAINIIKDIMDGYKYLCQNNIIHRDLKPANILRFGNKWKIADFGFAIHSQTEIKTKYNVGTPLYMPPQALIQNVYSVKSDIFSIGIILYELLTGCTPWQSRTQKDLIKKMGSIPFKVPQKFHISAATKLLLQNMCEVKFRKRMEKQQFMNLNLSQLSSPVQNPEQKTLRSEKSLQHQMSSRISHKSIQALPNLDKLASSKSILNAQQDVEQRKIQTINNQLLICQLHYCRFLYYLVRNSNCMLIDRKLSQKLGLIVFTHLLKLVKIIAQPNINCLNLQNWDRFKKSKKYLNTYLTIKEYGLRYEKQYINYLKFIDLTILQDVNDMFHGINIVNVLTIDFYNRAMRFLLPIIRIFNHNLGKKLLHQGCQVGKEQIGQIQALKSIYKYYKLLQMSVNHFQNYQHFQANCNIKINVDYKKSGTTLQSFNQLRQQLKNI